MLDPLRPVDEFVKRSENIFKKEYLVIGKRRVSSFTAWSIIAFFVGITVASAFLASRSGTLEGSQAAGLTRPVWSNWGNWKKGNPPQNTPTIQYRSKAKTSIQVVNGRRTRQSAPGYEQRQCKKNCKSLAAPPQISSPPGTKKVTEPASKGIASPDTIVYPKDYEPYGDTSEEGYNPDKDSEAEAG